MIMGGRRIRVIDMHARCVIHVTEIASRFELILYENSNVERHT
jgi:hypothetical protein